MARTFTKNTSNYVGLGTNTIGNLLNGVSKISIACWAKASSYSAGANDNRLFSEWIAANSGLILNVNGSGANKVLRVSARSVTGDALQSKDATSDIPTGSWFHVGGSIDIGGDSITPYINGAAQGGGSVVFGNTTYTQGSASSSGAIGADGAPTGSTASQWDGQIAELAIWADDIGAANFAALAKGVSPCLINPGALVTHWALMGRFSPEIDIISGKNATITGSIPYANHPPIIYPSTSFSRIFTTASGGGSAGVLGTSIGDLEYAAYAVKTGKIGITLNEQKMTYYTSVLGQQYASVTEAEVAFLKSKTSKWTETSIADLWNSYYTTRGVPNYPSLHDRAMYFYLNVGFE